MTISPEIESLHRAFSAFGRDRFTCSLGVRPALHAARTAGAATLARDASGAVAAARVTRVVDHLVRLGYGFVAQYAGAERDPDRIPIAILARGRYARAELAPFSPVELIALRPRSAIDPRSVTAVTALVRFLSDLGLDCTASVTMLDEVDARLSADELDLDDLDVRFVTGDPALHRALVADVLRPRRIAGARDRIARRLATWAQERTGSAGLEPDVVRGPGGIEDAARLLATLDDARRAYDVDGAATLAETGLRAALDGLRRAEFALHLVADDVAATLRRSRWPGVARCLAPERASDDGAWLRRAVVQWQESILVARDRLHEAILRRAHAEPRRGRAFADGFRMVDGEVAIERERVFLERPSRLVEVAVRAAAERVPVSRSLVNAARAAAGRLGARLAEDFRVGEALRAGLRLDCFATVLVTLRHANVLERVLPELAPARHFVRAGENRSLDDRAIVAVETFESLVAGRIRGPRRYLDGVERGDLLKLALLLFPAARRIGEAAFDAIAARLVALGFEPEEIDVVRFLVKERARFVTMSRGREDGHRAELDGFVADVETPERLRMLALSTWCDLEACDPPGTSRYFDSMMGESFDRAEPLIRARAAAARDRLVLGAVPHGAHESAARAHVAAMPAAYAAAVDPIDVARHVLLDATIDEGARFALAVDETQGARLWWVADDRPRLIGDVLTALAGGGADVESLTAHVRRDGRAFGSLRCSNDVELDPDRLRRALGGSPAGAEAYAAPRAGAGTDELEPIDVLFRRLGDPGGVVVRVRAGDRPRLLLDLIGAVVEDGFQIVQARAETSAGRVDDRFHLRRPDAAEVSDEQCEKVRDRIDRAIRSSVVSTLSPDQGGHRCT